MEWIDITIEKPIVAGKYLVKTQTSFGNTHRLDATFSITKDKQSGKEKSSFNVSNQIVTHWLKE